MSRRRLDALLLLLLWALLLWAASQFPQLDVPFAHPDGATRADLLALRGLGLHRVAGSLPAWLLTAATLVVGVVRFLAVLGRRRFPVDPPAEPVALAQLMPRLCAVHVGFRASSAASDSVVLGHARLGRWALTLGAGALLIGWLLHGLTVPAVVLETQPDGTVQAYRVEANRPGSAVAITGRCQRGDGSLRCSLAEGGVTGESVLRRGLPATFGGQSLTWVGERASALADEGRLRWLRGGADAAWYAFDVSVTGAVDIPALSARAALIDGGRGGPLVVATVSGQAIIAARPGLVTGPAIMRLDSPTRSRLRLGDQVPAWWWLIGVVLVALGVLLVGLVPAAEITLVDGRPTLQFCNEDLLRGRLTRALEAAEEAS